MSRRKTDAEKQENKRNVIRKKAIGNSLSENGYKILAKNFCEWIEYPELEVDEVSIKSTTIKGRFRCSEEGCNNFIRERPIKKVVEVNPECKCPKCKKKISAVRRTNTEAKRGNTIGNIAKQEGERGDRARKIMDQFVRGIDHPELKIEDCNWTSKYKAEWICKSHKSPECEKQFIRSIGKMTSQGRSCECRACSAYSGKIKRIKYEGHRNPLEGSEIYKEITSGDKGAKFIKCVDYPELSANDIAVNSQQQVVWLCNCCKKEFEASVCNRTRHKSGCPYCAGRKVVWGSNDLYTYAIKYQPDLINQWDEEENGKMEEYTRSADKRVKWKCAKCGKSFKKSIVKMTGIASNLCKKCSSRYSDSIPQQVIYYYVAKYFPDASIEYNCRSFEWLEGKELDIYLKINEHQYVIEYDGPRHGLKKDIEKDRLCEQNGCTILHIRDPKAEKYQKEDIGKNVQIINRRTAVVDRDLERCIREVLTFIIDKEHMKMDDVVIDIKSIIPQINYRMRDIVPRERSLVVLKPTVAQYLKKTLICDDEEVSITAEDIYANSNKVYVFQHFNERTGKRYEWRGRPHNMHEPYSCPIGDGD